LYGALIKNGHSMAAAPLRRMRFSFSKATSLVHFYMKNIAYI
jgi:hypothetical protein